MKKQALFLMAGALVAFASCNNAPTEGASQAQIDSTVNARVEEIRLQLMAENDSLINALAQMKADSMIAAMKGGGVRSTTKKTKTNNSTISTNNTNTGTGVATPTNSKDGRFNGQGNSNTDKKEGRFNEDAAKKQQEENTKKKAERFK